MTVAAARRAARTASAGEAQAPRPEASRARYPDETGFVERDGVRVFWERYGDGAPTILLMPTWSIFHARHWKAQIAYLARHFRVVTFDGRGNGRSDRPAESAAYADVEFAEDAVAVMDATGTARAVVAGLSMGAGYALRLAVDHPERVAGLVLFGSSIPLLDRPPEPDVDDVDDGGDRHDAFEDPLPDDEGWSKYNAHYWRRDWPGFAQFFAGEAIYTEPHSTKPIEDSMGWMLETDPETIIATERAPYLVPPDDWAAPPSRDDRAAAFVQRVTCPTLLAHGTEDVIIPIRYARRLAALLDAPLIEVQGGGHSTIGRDPVLANLVIRDFVRALEVES